MKTLKDKFPKGNLTYRPRLGEFKDCNGKLTFDGEDARSYGHWVFATKIKGRWVFNRHRYSVTTSKHQSAFRSFMSENGMKIAATVDFRESLNDSSFTRLALEKPIARLELTEIKLSRKGIPEKRRKDLESEIKRLKREIKTLKAMGAKLTRERAAKIKKEVRVSEKHRLERAREERAARRVVERAGAVLDLSTVSA